MVGISHTHRAMVSFPRRKAHKASCLLFFQEIRAYGKAVTPLKGGHKANLINTVSIIKTVRLYRFLFSGKDALNMVIDKRISLRRPLAAYLQHPPSFYLFLK